MKKTTIIAGVAALAIGTTSLAFVGAADARKGHGGQGGRGMPVSFAELDSDGDGQITQAEIDARREARFADMDSNGDGSVTLDEYKAAAAARASTAAEERFSALDVDGDGVLSRDAVEAQVTRGARRGSFIARLDTDGDGAVSEDEFATMGDRRAGFRRMHREGHSE